LGNLFRLTWAFLAILAPVVFIWSLARLRPRRVDRVGVLTLVVDFVQWHIPPLRRIAESLGCANSLSVLRLALAAGWPLHRSIQMASDVDANSFWQRQLRKWGRRIADGGDHISEGRRLRLPETLLSYLAVGLRDGDLDPALYNAEGYYTCLSQRWRRQFVQMIWPLATIYLGFLVCVFSMGLFQGMMALVDSCCEQIG
jgi:type II secretory pathway component PulF